MFPDPWLLTFCVFGLLVALGSTSGLINERLWISEPLVCALLGAALGPVGLDLLRVHPGGDSASATVLRETARVTLAIAVIGSAVRLPGPWLRTHWRGLAVTLGPGMLLMWGAGTLVSGIAFGLPLLTALMVGAAIAPTDPVLSAPLLTGRLAERAVPEHLRNGLTAESGINDGLAFPFVMLPVLLFNQQTTPVGREWFIHVVLYEVGGGVLIGIVTGWLACRVLRWARARPDAQPASMLTAVIALALTALAGARVIGSDGVLAAFVAGAVLNAGDWETKAEQHMERFQEALARFFDLPVMILFGAVVPWHAWGAHMWRSIAFAGHPVLPPTSGLAADRPVHSVVSRPLLGAVRRLVWPNRRCGSFLCDADPGQDWTDRDLARGQPRGCRLRYCTRHDEHPAHLDIRACANGLVKFSG